MKKRQLNDSPVPMNRQVKMRETMNSVEEALPLTERDPAIVMGQQDALSTLCRLITAELYVLRGRMLSKGLLAVGVAAIIVFVILLGVVTWSLMNRPMSDFVPPFRPRPWLCL